MKDIFLGAHPDSRGGEGPLPLAVRSDVAFPEELLQAQPISARRAVIQSEAAQPSVSPGLLLGIKRPTIHGRGQRLSLFRS